MLTQSYTLRGSAYWEDEWPIYVNRERESFTLPLHRHDFTEIHYVAEGQGFHYIGDERIAVQRGDLFIIPIGTPHVYRPPSQAAKDELIVYNCIFDPAILVGLQSGCVLPSDAAALADRANRPFRFYKDHRLEVRKCMEELHREYGLQQPGFQSMIYGLLTRLLILIHRLELESTGAASRSTMGRLTVVFEYLEEHYQERITLQQLADLLPVSASYLQRMLKEATGQTFTEYLQNLRINKCGELLLNTRLSVNEIAARSGYRDMKFFHQLFRKKTGQSPNQYRNRSGTM